MALDRRISIQRNEGVQEQNGEFVVIWIDVARVWAARRGAGTYDVLVGSQVREAAAVTWDVRFTAALAALTASQTRIVDAAGEIWNVDSIAESDARRRFLTFGTSQSALA